MFQKIVNTNEGIVSMTEDGLICLVDSNNTLSKYVNTKMSCKSMVIWKERILIGSNKGSLRLIDSSRLSHIQTFNIDSLRDVKEMKVSGDSVAIEDREGNIEKMDENGISTLHRSVRNIRDFQINEHYGCLMGENTVIVDSALKYLMEIERGESMGL